MQRRQFLELMGWLVAGSGLAGCQAGDRPTLRVDLLKGSIPSQLLQEFERSQARPPHLSLETQTQLSQLFEQLSTSQQSAPPAPTGPLGLALPWQQPRSPQPWDVMTLGDYWLTTAIQKGWLQPLDVDALSNWATLPPAWQALVTRDDTGQLAATGSVWAAPYRMSQLAIAYRADHVADWGWTPQAWADLWRPEVRGQLALPNHPRLVLGLVLHSLGLSANPTTPTAITAPSALATEWAALHQQVKLYASADYLQPLVIGDVAIAVGWSTDILPILATTSQVQAVIPATGTLLSADLWVQPKLPTTATATTNLAAQTALVQQWIDFYWQLPIATQLSILSAGTSPVLLSHDRQTLPSALQTNALRLPTPAQVAASEFLTPVTPATAQALWHQWQTVRQTG